MELPKILLVQPLGLDKGHPPSHTSKLAGSLVKLGADLEVLTYAGLRGKHPSLKSKIREVNIPLKPSSNEFYLADLLESQFLHNVSASLLTTLKAARVSRNYDIIHLMDGLPSVLLPLVRIFPSSSIVYNVHSSLEMGAPILGNWIYKHPRLHFICFSERVEKSVSRVSDRRSKITTIPFGISEPTETPPRSECIDHLNIPQSENIFLIFGINHSYKDYRSIFEAFKEVSSDFLLIFAGPITGKVNNPHLLSSEYSMDDKVTIFDEYIPENELRKYLFGVADGMLLSFKKSFIAASGTLCQAAEYQVPPIASDVGVLGESVKRNKLGLTFDPENTASLKKKIIEFIENDTTNFEKNLRDFALENSWDKVGEKHISFYKKIRDR